MIQLSNRKKIIIALSIVLIIIIFIIVFVSLKNDSTTKPLSNDDESEVISEINTAREMTEEEKIKLLISPSQEAEVVNEKNGIYIYRIKK